MLYHYLLVGLQELQLDTKQKLSEEELVQTLESGMSKSDRKLLQELMLRPDDDKITAQLEALKQQMAEDEQPCVLSDEDLRWQLVYEQGSRSRNAFVRDWYTFNLALNNVMAAQICRKHGFDLKKAIVGEGPIQEALRTSKAKDFELSDQLEEIGDILRLSEIEDLYERERKTDALRWRWLEERTLFHYYEVENVLAYYLMAKMLYRWDLLNVEEGQKVFRALIADMKRDIRFDK